MDDTLTISKAQLRAALLGWAVDARAGNTRTHEETDVLPVEQVAQESVELLWAGLKCGRAPSAAAGSEHGAQHDRSRQ